MLVHLLATARRRGAESFAVQLADELRKSGIRQTVLVLRNEPSALGLNPDIELCVYSGGERNLPAKLLFLRRQILSRGADIVLCHGMKPMQYAVLALLLSGALRPRLILKKIGFTLPWITRLRTPRIALNRWLLEKTDLCIALGERQFLELAGPLGVSPSRIARIPNARVPPAGLPLVSRADNVILMLGALSREKAPDVALDVLAIARSAGLDLRLQFVGDGPLKKALEQRAAADFEDGVVSFIGKVDDVWPYLCEATALLLCSRTEGVPGVLIEAAFAGLPVVTWDVGDVRAIVEDQLTGLVTEYGDVAALAGAVAQLMAEPGLRRSLGKAAESRSGRYRMDQVAGRYLEEFGRLAGTAGPEYP